MTRLEQMAPDLFLSSGIVIQTMLTATGYTLLADAGAPTSWKDTTGARSGTYHSDRTYSGRAELAGYPQLYLLFEILSGHMEGRSADTIHNLLEDTDSLSVPDAEHFTPLMTTFATGTFATGIGSVAASNRVVSRGTAFLCEYGEQGTPLRCVSQQADVQCSD